MITALCEQLTHQPRILFSRIHHTTHVLWRFACLLISIPILLFGILAFKHHQNANYQLLSRRLREAKSSEDEQEMTRVLEQMDKLEGSSSVYMDLEVQLRHDLDVLLDTADEEGVTLRQRLKDLKEAWDEFWNASKTAYRNTVEKN